MRLKSVLLTTFVLVGAAIVAATALGAGPPMGLDRTPSTAGSKATVSSKTGDVSVTVNIRARNAGESFGRNWNFMLSNVKPSRQGSVCTKDLPDYRYGFDGLEVPKYPPFKKVSCPKKSKVATGTFTGDFVGYAHDGRTEDEVCKSDGGPVDVYQWAESKRTKYRNLAVRFRFKGLPKMEVWSTTSRDFSPYSAGLLEIFDLPMVEKYRTPAGPKFSEAVLPSCSAQLQEDFEYMVFYFSSLKFKFLKGAQVYKRVRANRKVELKVDADEPLPAPPSEDEDQESDL